MKKIIATLIVFQTTLAIGQNLRDKFDLVLGYSYSRQLDTNWQAMRDKHNTHNPIIGISFTDTLKGKILLTTKLCYTSKGSKWNVTEEDANGKYIFNYNYKFHYLEMPFEFKYLFYNRFTINAGAVFSFLLLDNENQYSYRENYNTNQIFEDYKRSGGRTNANKFDIGLKIGATVKLNKLISLDLAAQQGFINVSKIKYGDLGYQTNYTAGLLINLFR